MNFNYLNLTSTVREGMLKEIPLAETEKRLHISSRLTEAGKEGWPALLMQAASMHNEHWLAHQLENYDFIEIQEIKLKPKGGYTVAYVPHTASETLADGEFNRYYMIAVCQEALSQGISSVTVYRAKERGEPKQSSLVLIGTELNASEVIEELRKLPKDSRHPLSTPNSGISVKFESLELQTDNTLTTRPPASAGRALVTNPQPRKTTTWQ